MSKSVTSSDLSAYPVSGRWTWNENGHHLEFVSNNLSSERQERKRQQQKHDRSSARPIESGRPRSTRHGIKQSPDHMFVTLHDVKEVGKCMMSEVEAISPAFDGLYNTVQFDNLLLLLLNYFHSFFMKRDKETNPNPIHIEQSLAEKQFLKELDVKIELSIKQLARSYGVLILGLGLSQEHHMICGKSRTSNTYKDRGQFETMYSFCSFFVWIAYRRREYDVVKKEINRLMRSDTFNPAIHGKMSSQQEASDSESETLSPAEYRRTLGSRPPIKDIINQRSDVMVSILPKPNEEASWLFKKSCKPVCNSLIEAGGENAIENILELGIIGEPLSLFNHMTLSTLDTDEEQKEKCSAESADDSIMAM